MVKRVQHIATTLGLGKEFREAWLLGCDVGHRYRRALHFKHYTSCRVH